MEVPRFGSSYRNQTKKEFFISSQSQKKVWLEIRTFLKYAEDYEENVKIICCDNAGEKKILKKIVQNIVKKSTFNLRHQALHRNMVW